MAKLRLPSEIIEETINEHCDQLHRKQAYAIMDALHGAGFIVVQREDMHKLESLTIPAMIKAFDL